MNIDYLLGNLHDRIAGKNNGHYHESIDDLFACMETGLDDAEEAAKAIQPQPTEKIHHPRHYNAHPSGVEAIDLCEHLGFNVGNAVKYLFRCGHKAGEAIDTDLRKARFYLARATQANQSTMIVSDTEDHLLAIEAIAQRVIEAEPKSVLGLVLHAWVHTPSDQFSTCAMAVEKQRLVAQLMLDAFDKATDRRFVP